MEIHLKDAQPVRTGTIERGDAVAIHPIGHSARAMGDQDETGRGAISQTARGMVVADPVPGVDRSEYEDRKQHPDAPRRSRCTSRLRRIALLRPNSSQQRHRSSIWFSK
jgi:hypothetical protein